MIGTSFGEHAAYYRAAAERYTGQGRHDDAATCRARAEEWAYLADAGVPFGDDAAARAALQARAAMSSPVPGIDYPTDADLIALDDAPSLTPDDATALAAVAQAVAYRRAAARRDKAISRYLEASPERRAVMSDIHSRHASHVYRMAEQMTPAAWSVVFAGEALPHVTLETIRPYMHGRSVA